MRFISVGVIPVVILCSKDNKVKILIFDDNADLLECMQLTLEHYNCEVKGTTDLKHFYYLADSFKPDAVLIDVNLGEEDGRDICRTLRSDYKYNHLPIVLFSGMSKNLADHGTYGADAILEKPFEIKFLIPTLMFAIKERKSIQNQMILPVTSKALPEVIFR